MHGIGICRLTSLHSLSGIHPFNIFRFRASDDIPESPTRSGRLFLF